MRSACASLAGTAGKAPDPLVPKGAVAAELGCPVGVSTPRRPGQGGAACPGNAESSAEGGEGLKSRAWGGGGGIRQPDFIW